MSSQMQPLIPGRLVMRLSAVWEVSTFSKALLELFEASFPGTSIALYLVERGSARLQASQYFDGVETHLPRASGLLERLRSGVSVSAADVNGSYLRQIGARRAYALKGTDDLVGFVVVGDTGTSVPEREHQHVQLTAWMAFAGVVLDRIRWRVQAGRGGEQSQSMELAQLARTFGLTHSLQSLLRRVLEGAVEHTAANKGSLMLIDSESNELVVRVVRGLPNSEMENRINNGDVPCVRLKVGQGVAGRVAETGKGEIINDVQSSPDYKNKSKGRKGALLCVPLMVQGHSVGVLNLSMTNETDRFTTGDLDVAFTIARDAAVAVHRVQLFEDSCRDPFTGLFSGQVVEALLVSEVARATRYGSSLSVVACNIGAKLSDDEYRTVGDVLRKTMRGLVDMSGHFGNGWFGLILPETDVLGAEVLCQRLEAALKVALPQIKRRHFAATEWKKDEPPFELFERVIDALEKWSHSSANHKIQTF